MFASITGTKSKNLVLSPSLICKAKKSLRSKNHFIPVGNTAARPFLSRYAWVTKKKGTIKSARVI